MAEQNQPRPTLTPAERAERRRALDSSLGTTLAAGVSPGAEALALGERWAAGEMTLDEVIAAIKALNSL